MYELINHLESTYSKTVLYQIFGIKSDTWRQHKCWYNSKGVKGQMMSSAYYKSIKDNYITFLRDKTSEVSDIDSKATSPF
jgi:hypothetical protein